MTGELLLVPRLFAQECREEIGIGLWSREAVPVIFEIARVHLLLELMANRDAEHRFAQENGFVNEREPPVGDHRPRRGEVPDEPCFREVPNDAIAVYRVA